jgi:hypothetical protein
MRILSITIKADHEGNVTPTMTIVSVARETEKTYRLAPLVSWADRGAFSFRTQIMKSEIDWVQRETSETSIAVMCWTTPKSQEELDNTVLKVKTELHSLLRERMDRLDNWNKSYEEAWGWNASMPEV